MNVRLKEKINALGLNQRKFYHYSKQRYSLLKSINAQKGMGLTKIIQYKEINNINYKDNISLFIDPIPLDIIGSLYKNHPFWYKGNEIYEHEIITTDIPDELFYWIVETPKRWAFWNNHIASKNPDNDILFDRYLKELFIYLSKIGEMGYNKNELIFKTKDFVGTTKDFYKKSAEKDPTTKLYAPFVPHVMVYPKGGEIKVNNICKVIVK